MPDPSAPPHGGLRPSVKTYLAACVWDAQQLRVETTGGVAVVAWLNQTGTPVITTTVQWEAGTASDLGNAVPAAIPQLSFDIIKSGTLDSQTGVVAYGGKSYRFQFRMASGVAQMAAFSV